MPKAIDFQNPGDMSKISCSEIYEQLLLLRDDPDAFEKAANGLKKALISQLSGGGSAEFNCLQQIQQGVDDLVGQSPDPMTGAAEVFFLMTQKFGEGVDKLLDQIAVEAALKERPGNPLC